jgi:cell wall-active antibiotic response 4TMS protein YvqF
MKCAVHTDADATAYCRNCGKALCPECTRTVQGMHYCEPCLAAIITQRAEARRKRHSPAIAFILGFIPGLGAVYNREYSKALVFVAIFVGLVTADSTESRHVLYSLLISFFVLYMPIEALITASHLRDAEEHAIPAAAPVSTPVAASAAAATPIPAPAPAAPPRVRRPHLAGPVILVVIGTLCLLDNLGWMDAGRVIAHGWPLILIAIGLYQVMKNRR